ncbi:MAG: hypothetical protein V2J10_05315 [Wenzhouxiangella sp.]|jgi:hypothetical protein|nr:hypothetical protein [Wenzhouxiangella sp.]
MSRQSVAGLIWGVVFVIFMAPASADELLIEKVRERMLRDLPENGLTMSEVEARYGAPEQRYAAVGQPPITRWSYPDYNVYFEHELVIESVLNDAVVREAEADPN